LRQRPKSQSELPTTSADIYLGNLDGQIEELNRLLRERPNQLSNVILLSAVHHTRGRYRGDLDEIQQGIDGATACAKLAPNDATCYLVRAEQEQSLHRFKESRADLEHARQLQADPSRVADLQNELDWNDGVYDRAIAGIRASRRAHSATGPWIREAQLEHDLGNDDAADVAFETAEDLVRDTNPFGVAHLNVQRGIQKSAIGRLDQAVLFFREAVARMPTYVAGNEHLAEALHQLGQDDEATKIYERVVQLSNDPEFSHALAVLYAAHGKPAEAKALEEKARKGYDALLKKYPEAMAWHAAEFYSAIGEKKRALELLQKNVVLRPNSTSLVALAGAELENGHLPAAKKAIDQALAMPVVSASLFATAARVYDKSGDATKAGEFRDRAKKLDPRSVAQ
jgi:tetratricopeptide (TPR) repeat protein